MGLTPEEEPRQASTSGQSPTPTLDEQQPAAYPLEESPAPALPPEADAGTTRALSSLLTATPFIDLHLKAGGVHPKRETLCFACDFVLRLLSWFLLVGIILAVAWKVLAPLPDLTEPRKDESSVSTTR